MVAFLLRKVRANYSAIFVAAFIALLLLPLRGFSGNISDFNKTFWGYEMLLQGYTAARLYLLQDQIFEKTFVGQDHWLVFTGDNSLDDYQNTRLFSDDQLRQIQRHLDGLNERLGKKGVRFLVVITPSKNTIYPEYMLPQIQVLGKESRIDQLVAYQQAHGQAQILDLRPALRAARQEHQVYYATDTHWNQYGIFAGYQAILTRLQPEFPMLKPHSLSDFRYVSLGEGGGDLSVIGTQRFIKEEMFQLEPRFKRQQTQIQLTQGGQLPGRMIAVYTPNPGLPRALVLHDSYLYGMIPFLADHFQWAIFHWTSRVDEDFIDGEKPDVVILEVTEVYLDRILDLIKK